MSHNLRSLFRWVVVLVGCTTMSLAAFAQSTVTGAIAGTVVDPSKAVVVGAKVTARNLDTNTQATALSDALGRFRVVQLQPGTYTVTAVSANFAPRTSKSVIVEVGKITELEFALNLAGKSEAVDVTGEAPMVNTLQQDFSTNIDQAMINNLPSNGRRWSNVALLTPGAGMGDSNGYGLISFRGISGLMNNTTVDGGDNNQAFFSEERGRTRVSYVVSQSAVQEFQVNTSNYSSEYGRAAGAVVNTVTKSGTNNLHGEGFYYIRDNELGAVNPFTKHLVQQSDGSYVTTPFKPTDRRQQFGGNLGGPVIKDKLFFFFNYDGQRQNIPATAMAAKPDVMFGPYKDTKGNISLCADSATTVASPTFSCNELSTIATGMYNLGKATPTLAQMTAAKVAGDAGLKFLSGTTGDQRRNNNQDIFFPKLDWRVNQNNTFTLSYNRMRRNAFAGYQSTAVVNYGTGDFGNEIAKIDMLNARLSSAITRNLSNELRFSYGRDLDAATVGPESTSYQNLAKTATALVNGMLPDTYFSAGAGGAYNFGVPYTLNRYAYPDERKTQIANSTSWAHGRHMLKWGVDFIRTNDYMNGIYSGPGDYSYSSRTSWIIDYTNALAGKPSRNYSSFQQGFGVPAWEFHTSEYAGFLQDDIRLTRRLTVNLGVRYEYEQLPNPQIPNSTLDTALGYAATSKFPSDKNNFAPRIGFAWDMFGDGKTSLRGGYGIYYGRIVNSTIMSAIYGTGLTKDGRYLGQETFTLKPASGPLYPNVLPVNTIPPQPNVAFFSPNFQNPQIHQADLVLEREVAHNTIVSASYLLSLGRQMVNFYDMNQSSSTLTLPQTFMGGNFDGITLNVPIYQSLRDKYWGHMGQIVSNVNSNYNALVAQVNRRMTKGLQFQANYTWSHTLDSGQNTTTFTDNNDFYDPYDLKKEYGNSNYDVRQRFVATAVWQPQFFKNSGKMTKAALDGWLLAPMITIQSGMPFTEAVNGYPALPADNSSYAWSGSSLNESGGTSRIAPLVGRNSWRMPGLRNVDLRLSRQFRVREGQKLEVVAEAFNLFNHRNVFRVQNSMYTMCGSNTTPSCAGQPKGTGRYTPSTLTKNAQGDIITVAPNTWVYDPTFGTPTSASTNLYRERQVQFAIRYSF